MPATKRTDQWIVWMRKFRTHARLMGLNTKARNSSPKHGRQPRQTARAGKRACYAKRVSGTPERRAGTLDFGPKPR
eukprot:11214890-Lingulodinium_polyedra.AAC.1